MKRGVKHLNLHPGEAVVCLGTDTFDDWWTPRKVYFAQQDGLLICDDGFGGMGMDTGYFARKSEVGVRHMDLKPGEKVVCLHTTNRPWWTEGKIYTADRWGTLTDDHGGVGMGTDTGIFERIKT